MNIVFLVLQDAYLRKQLNKFQLLSIYQPLFNNMRTMLASVFTPQKHGKFGIFWQEIAFVLTSLLLSKEPYCTFKQFPTKLSISQYHTVHAFHNLILSAGPVVKSFTKVSNLLLNLRESHINSSTGIYFISYAFLNFGGSF